MESSRSKRQRLMPSYVSSRPRPDVPARFESLNDDTLTTVLEFVGNKSYVTYAGINKHCKEIYLSTKGMTKETFLYGYAPLSVIRDRVTPYYTDLYEALGKGVVLYNRRDVLAWLIQERNIGLLKEICNVAAKEGRIDILNEVLINVEDGHGYTAIHRDVDRYAARGGKVNVLEWLKTKGLYIDEEYCAMVAARHGQLHILQWLRDVQGLKLFGSLYDDANECGQLLVMKWLREQSFPWNRFTFYCAAKKGNLNILQWLHNEGCPFPEEDDYRVREVNVKPEVIDWCRSNGYGDRLI